MAELSSADINDLPDSAFAYIEPGGKKDSDGKTTPRSLRHFPIHDAAHVRNALARAGQSPFGSKALPAIHAAAKKFGVDVEEQQQEGRSMPLPFESGGVFVRSMVAGSGVVENSGGMPKLFGTLAVFDEWTEIKSASEGHFMEMISRGSFAKTIKENPNAPIMYQHGEDPQIGPKPIAVPTRLEETSKAVEYEGDLFEADYVRSILPVLKAGKSAGLGSSFTMRMPKGKYELDRFPKRSSRNPDQLPELVHSEIVMLEYGPGVLPYYAGTTAGVRSSTDEFVFGRFARDPDRLRQLLTTVPEATRLTAATKALSDERAGETHSGGESRNAQQSVPARKFETPEEWSEWLSSRT